MTDHAVVHFLGSHRPVKTLKTKQVNYDLPIEGHEIFDPQRLAQAVHRESLVQGDASLEGALVCERNVEARVDLVWNVKSQFLKKKKDLFLQPTAQLHSDA